VEFSEDVALAAEVMHRWADETNDVQDHDEYHACGAVLAMINGQVLSEKEFAYIVTWIENLNARHP
jgi:hypothetical protein